MIHDHKGGETWPPDGVIGFWWGRKLVCQMAVACETLVRERMFIMIAPFYRLRLIQWISTVLKTGI